MNEQSTSKGALLSPLDVRDFSYKGFSTIPYDWSVPFSVTPILNVKNQGLSSSCGGQAGAYYGAVLEALNDSTMEERSAKFIYAQVFAPGGGSYLRDICDLVVKQGWGKESLTPSYEGSPEAILPPSELFMEKVEDITTQARSDASTAKALAYANVQIDIDSIAQAVRDNNGAIIMIGGQNNGTWLSAYPAPAVTPEWRHFLYVGKLKMENGKKYLGVINSWGSTVGEGGWQWLEEGHIPFIYECRTIVFKKSFTFNTNLHLGMSGTDVLELQKRMVLEKCATYMPTGWFGPLTLLSVIKYQLKNNIAPAFGYVGPLTRASLNA